MNENPPSIDTIQQLCAEYFVTTDSYFGRVEDENRTFHDRLYKVAFRLRSKEDRIQWNDHRAREDLQTGGLKRIPLTIAPRKEN